MKILKKQLLQGVLSFILIVSSSSVSSAGTYTGYLLAHFTGESGTGEQIYFSTSVDGLHWSDVNNSLPVLTSNIGEKGVRDPALIRSADGSKFWLIATDLRIASGKGWGVAQHSGSTNLVVWQSTNLVDWSKPWMVDVAGSIPNAGNAWAPEAIYDEIAGNYVVYWATISPLNGIDKGRIYYATTTDFVIFSEPKMYIDRLGEKEIIDTQIIKVEGGNYKYYRASRDGQITFEGSDSILGSWVTIGNLSGLGLTGSDVEGPIMYKFNGENKWGVMVDQYATGRGYLPLTTTDFDDPNKFTIINNSRYSLGSSHKRHGSILNITSDELNVVRGAVVGEPTSKIQSYGDKNTYIRHYDFKAKVEVNVQPVVDSMWILVPGLADSDGYISFESVNYPGYYLRHYSFNMIVEKNDGTSTFAGDATFRILDGLADSSWSSFQSYNHSDRYIRTSDSLLKLDPISTSAEGVDATFRVVTEVKTPLETETEEEPVVVEPIIETSVEEAGAGLFSWWGLMLMTLCLLGRCRWRSASLIQVTI